MCNVGIPRSHYLRAKFVSCVSVLLLSVHEVWTGICDGCDCMSMHVNMGMFMLSSMGPWIFCEFATCEECGVCAMWVFQELTNCKLGGLCEGRLLLSAHEIWNLGRNL